MIAQQARPHVFSGRSALDEDDATIATSDAGAAEGQRFDGQIEIHRAQVRKTATVCKHYVFARSLDLPSYCRLPWCAVKLTVVGSGDAFCAGGALHSCNIL